MGGIAYAVGQGGVDIAVLNAGVGARALGMGSAFTAVADNADAPYWNPAGLGFEKDSRITASQTKLSTDADHYYLSYVTPAFGGTVGISWIQIGTGNLVVTSSETDANNEVVNAGAFSYFSNAYLLSYGRELNDRISFGLTAKYLTSDMQQVAGGQAYGYSVAPGILFKLRKKDGKASPGINLGIKIDELLNEQSWGTGTVEKAPPKVRAGLALDTDTLGLFTADVSQVMLSNYAAEASFGYEWSTDGISLRAGWNNGALTAGAGFESGHARIDYAYVAQNALSKDNVHRISMTGKW